MWLAALCLYPVGSARDLFRITTPRKDQVRPWKINKIQSFVQHFLRTQPDLADTLHAFTDRDLENLAADLTKKIRMSAFLMAPSSLIPPDRVHFRALLTALEHERYQRQWALLQNIQQETRAQDAPNQASLSPALKDPSMALSLPVLRSYAHHDMEQMRRYLAKARLIMGALAQKSPATSRDFCLELAKTAQSRYDRLMHWVENVCGWSAAQDQHRRDQIQQALTALDAAQTDLNAPNDLTAHAQNLIDVLQELANAQYTLVAQIHRLAGQSGMPSLADTLLLQDIASLKERIAFVLSKTQKNHVSETSRMALSALCTLQALRMGLAMPGTRTQMMQRFQELSRLPQWDTAKVSLLFHPMKISHLSQWKAGLEMILRRIENFEKSKDNPVQILLSFPDSYADALQEWQDWVQDVPPQALVGPAGTPHPRVR